MAGTLFALPGLVAVNSAGTPYASATLTFTQAGTSTAVDVYTTAALTTPAGVSGVVTADANGQFDAVYLDPSTSYDYKCVLKNSAGDTLETWDNIPRGTVPEWCGTAGGTVDVITLTPTVPLSAYTTGRTLRFKSSGANTGATTVNVSGLGAKSIRKGGTTVLAAGDIASGSIVEITYDGTYFQLTNTAGSSASTTGSLWCGTATGSANAITLTPTSPITSYDTGTSYRFFAASANTSSTVTVAISGLAAKNVRTKTSTGIVAGTIQAGSLIDLTYDGTYMMIASTAEAAGVNTANTFTANQTFSGYLVASSNILTAPYTLTYGATVDTDAANSTWHILTVTNGTAFTIAEPTNAQSGMTLCYTIKNTSGGATGTITWNAVFKKGTFTSPATGYNRSILFMFDGTNWIELFKSAADVPN